VLVNIREADAGMVRILVGARSDALAGMVLIGVLTRAIAAGMVLVEVVVLI